MNQRVWSYYLREVLMPDIDCPSVVLADNLKCHVSKKSYKILEDELFSAAYLQPLPANTTSVLQPLDVGVMGPFKQMCLFVDGSPHALDGFYLDIPIDLQGQLDERLLFEAMPRLEPHFLWGSYNSVSATSSLAGARYRLHFLGSDIPSSMLVGDRMVEEFVFRGRCLRVYGRGRFFRDHQLVRINLDGPTPPDNLA
ncbi:hypothetical protein DYB28_011002 [Aphanomyces astaci]|uniref:DDE-1 domain-containing protein n=1 Tax=Aphanomyces astaci TaxID=112090 RepID=A0A9X8E8W2_APHAT|nr:hypothetical protein DYB28_011002 [Aphanomyces astaci]